MNLNLDLWQKQILKQKGNILLCTGRQVGKTTIFAIKAAEFLVSNPKKTVLVVSLTEDQAELIIMKILQYLEDNYKSRIAKKGKKPTKKIIRLINDSMVQARPVGNTGDSIRGFTGDVLILDEASRMPEDVFLAAKPTLLTTAGEVWMCSTPFGKQGYFFECFQNKEARFKVFHVSSEEVINNRKVSEPSWTTQRKEFALKFLEAEKKDLSKLQYGQEYLGLFLEDLMQYFPDDLIKACQKLQRSSLQPFSKRKYYLGVDIGGHGGAETTLEIFDGEDKKHLLQKESIVVKNEMITDTERLIIHNDNIWHFRKIYIDSGGIGAGVYDHLLEVRSIGKRIEAIDNSKRALTPFLEKKEKWDYQVNDPEPALRIKLMKEDLYNNLKCLMERKEIELLDDPEIFQSLKSVQYEFDMETKSFKLFGNYTHICEGIIRAVWCVKDKTLNLWVY